MIKVNHYKPEGYLIRTSENRDAISSLSNLERAMKEGRILESTVLLCDSNMRLHVDLYGITGIIEKEDVVYCREGEALKDIAVITRVGKPVCFKIIAISEEHGRKVAHLSRREAQRECIENYLSGLIPGDIIPAKVTHNEKFGAFVDIGCGVPSLLSVDSISVSRISHPSDRLSIGDDVFVAVKSVESESGRIYVTMKELLGTWLENASRFEPGQTVAGIVRSVENYGVFVELAPNLAGLAEIREDTNDRKIAEVGSYVAAYIKSIIPEKMKIKLVLIDTYRGEIPSPEPYYYIDTNTTSHIDRWQYSPDVAHKVIETVFEEN